MSLILYLLPNNTYIENGQSTWLNLMVVCDIRWNIAPLAGCNTLMHPRVYWTHKPNLALNYHYNYHYNYTHYSITGTGHSVVSQLSVAKGRNACCIEQHWHILISNKEILWKTFKNVHSVISELRINKHNY